MSPDVPLGPGKSLVVDPPDGKLPLQPWAAAQRKENVAKYVDQNVQCFLSGAVRHMYEAPAYQIIQTPGYIAIPSEESHATRIITMANRPHLGKNILLWQGDARGRWDGTTLVVESTNHNGRVFLDRQGTFYTDSAILTERFMMLDQNTIAYGATVDDPLVYTRPFTIAFLLTRHTTKGFEILEEACFEGEADAKRLNTLGFKTYPGITSKDVPAIKARHARHSADRRDLLRTRPPHRRLRSALAPLRSCQPPPPSNRSGKEIDLPLWRAEFVKGRDGPFPTACRLGTLLAVRTFSGLR